jgi:hypothetical protein
MSKHPALYPAIAVENVHAQIAAIEARLSRTDIVVLDRASVAAAEPRLRTGDLIAFVGSKPGILVTHAGFVRRGDDGVPRVLHASSYHKKVLLGSSVESYVSRRAERRGVMIVRPLPPSERADPALTRVLPAAP